MEEEFNNFENEKLEENNNIESPSKQNEFGNIVITEEEEN